MNPSMLKLFLELGMWALTIVLACLIMLPVYLSLGKGYPFYFSNILFIFIFLTFTRYIFLLKHTYVARSLIFKLLILFTAIPLIFYLLDKLGAFQGFCDDIGLQSLVNHLSMDNQDAMMKYIRAEMLFFGVGAIIVAILFPIRMMISIWRVINKDTV